MNAVSETALTEDRRLDLLKAHYRCQNGLFISRLSERGHGLIVSSDAARVPMWNHAAWLGGSAAQLAGFLESAFSERGPRDRPVVYLCAPGNEDLRALAEAGFEKFDEEAWMTLPEDAGDGARSVRVQEVTERGVDAFIEAFSASFFTQQAGYARVLRARPAPGAPLVRHFALNAGGKTVSVGTIILHQEFAAFYNVGTPPAERRKGYAAELCAHLIAIAREFGCKTIFLQVENNSPAQRLYQRLGFRTEFIRSGFRRSSWTGTNRPSLSAILGCQGSSVESIPEYSRESRPLHVSLAQRLSERGRDFAIAAWACLIYRYTGEETALFSVRESSAREKLAVRANIARESTVRDWLASLRNLPSASTPEAGETLLCLHAAPVLSQRESPEHPLELHFAARDAGQIEAVYRAEFFSKDSIRRLLAHFSNLLEWMVDHPEALVQEAELLAPAERHRLLVTSNQRDFAPAQAGIANYFEAQVERSPDAPALLLADTDARAAARMTYRQLNRKANRLAHRLGELGVQPGTFVGAFLDRSLDTVASLLAVLKAGGIWVPIDPAYPRERIEFILHDTEAAVVITRRNLASLIEENRHTKVLCIDDPADFHRPESERNPAPAASMSDGAYLIYTSGSTGCPKGVLVSHQAIADHCIDCRTHYGLSPSDRVLQFSSFNFDASLEQLLPALISGASVVMRGNDVWSSRAFARRLGESQLTVIDVPTAYWHQLADDWSSDPGVVPANALRLVIVGGEALSAQKLAAWRQTPLAKVRLINAYGPTEATITAASCEVPPSMETPDRTYSLPIGRARGSRTLYVLDGVGHPVPIGVPGELYIGGPQLAQGYHNRPDITSERFVPNPFTDEPDARLYKTGDLVRYLEDGNLEFLGRVDDQVKIRGFRIELGEIEHCLRQHPGVAESVVLARTEPAGLKKLVAYVTVKSSNPHPGEILSFLKQRLPEYMLPSNIVILDSFPLLPSGKIDRRALPEPSELNAGGENIQGPRDAAELQIQILFERVLKRVPVDIHTSFFELGGDSLQALELLVEIQKATGKQLPLGTLYQSSTVEALAKEVRSCGGESHWSSLVPLQTSGKRPPFFLLHTTPGDILGYGNLVYRLDADQPCHGFQSLGLKDAALSHTTIQGMANYYVGLLRQSFPKGPYYLGGWCYGGIVALEMARLLREQRESVALLALLETVALPPSILNHRYYTHRLGCLLRMSPRRWLVYAREKAKYNREARIANKMRFRQADPNAAATGELTDARLARLEHVYNANLKALRGYRSVNYDGKITLFNAAERDPALIPDPHYGWVGLAREIEIKEVPGNHDTMLFEPNVSVLAELLNTCLIDAQTKNQA